MLTCLVEGCSKHAYMRGLCGTHYHRQLRRGTFEAARLTRDGRTDRQVFDDLCGAHLASGDSCWPWQGNIGTHGYGRLGTKLAHVVSWNLHFGPVPFGLHVLHTCDNHQCVRPSHLFVGTPKDNSDDKVSKDRQARGVMSPLAKLDDDKVRAIRSSAESSIVLSALYKVHPVTLRKARRGATWKHVHAAPSPNAG